MGEALPAQLFPNVYRMIGVGAFAGGKPDEAVKWWRTARELEPTFQWDVNDMDLGSPMYATYVSARDGEGTTPARIEGKDLNIPAGSHFLLDGRPLSAPAATPDRYHLLQQVADAGGVRASWVITGNGFPDRVLAEQVASLNEVKEEATKEKEKKKKEKKKGEPQQLSGGYTTDDVVTIQRERPPLKTPMLILGGVGVLAAGGLYAASYPAAASFEAAKTQEELDAARSRTNLLVVASVGTLAAGVGMEWFGIVLDGGGVVGMTVEF
jgi:hypothetical protein